MPLEIKSPASRVDSMVQSSVKTFTKISCSSLHTFLVFHPSCCSVVIPWRLLYHPNQTKAQPSWKGWAWRSMPRTRIIAGQQPQPPWLAIIERVALGALPNWKPIIIFIIINHHSISISIITISWKRVMPKEMIWANVVQSCRAWNWVLRHSFRPTIRALLAKPAKNFPSTLKRMKTWVQPKTRPVNEPLKNPFFINIVNHTNPHPRLPKRIRSSKKYGSVVVAGNMPCLLHPFLLNTNDPTIPSQTALSKSPIDAKWCPAGHPRDTCVRQMTKVKRKPETSLPRHPCVGHPQPGLLLPFLQCLEHPLVTRTINP